MHVLLIQPLNANQVWAGVSESYLTKGFHAFPPLQILSLSAWLKAPIRHRVSLLAAQKEQLDRQQIQRRIAAINPDIAASPPTPTPSTTPARWSWPRRRWTGTCRWRGPSTSPWTSRCASSTS